MRNIRRRYCCLNNNYMNLNTSNNCTKPDLIEDSCKNIECNQNYNENCSCGFDDDTMSNVFPELVSPYSPGDSMKEIKYLAATNTIGKGCNKCQ